MAQGNIWKLDGNTNASATTFIGSTNNNPFAVRTNNIERFNISGTGSFFFNGLNGVGSGFLYTDGTGLLQRLVFTGNANQVLLGNGTFGNLASQNYFSLNAGNQLSTIYKLGIGVSAPTEMLEVNGNAVFNGIVTAEQLNITNVANAGKTLFFKGMSMCMDGYDAALGTKNEICAINAPLFVNSKPTFAQNTFINANNLGKVGIGTETPSAKLTVVGSTLIKDGPIQFLNYSTTSATLDDYVLALDSNGFVQKGAVLKDLIYPAYEPVSGEICKDGNGGYTSPAVPIWIYKPGIIHTSSQCVPNPLVGIGLPNPTAKLHIKLMNGAATAPILVQNGAGHDLMKLNKDGLLYAREVKVNLETAWPDYVFNKAYQLMPLKEVKAYIATNQHLPNIPSAKEIATEGLNLGEMDKLLLEKVEELTLYLIQLEEKLQAQNQLLEAQQVQIKALSKNNK